MDPKFGTNLFFCTNKYKVGFQKCRLKLKKMRWPQHQGIFVWRLNIYGTKIMTFLIAQGYHLLGVLTSAWPKVPIQGLLRSSFPNLRCLNSYDGPFSYCLSCKRSLKCVICRISPNIFCPLLP